MSRAALPRTHALEPFLPEVVPVEFAGSVRGWAMEDGVVHVEVETVRFDPHEYDYYGTPTVTTYRPRGVGQQLHVSIVALDGGAFRVLTASARRAVPRTSPMLVGEPARAVATVAEHDASLVVSGDGTQLVVDRHPFRLRLIDREGREVFTTRAWDDDAFARQPREKVWNENEQRWVFWNRYAYPIGLSRHDSYPAVFVSAELAHDERIWGFGEGFGSFDRRGSDQWLWIQEAFGNSSPACYKQTPFWVSSRGYGAFLHSARAIRVRTGSLDHTAISLLVEDEQELDLFLLPGRTPQEVVSQYCALTGSAPVPPRWSLGFWMSRISYDTQEQVESVAAQIRDRRIPCDVLHIDTNWFPVDWECDLEFSTERFPDPEGMFARLREQGLRVSLWQWPNLAAGSAICDEAESRGLLVRRDNGAAYFRSGFVKDAALIDYSNPAAVAWIQEKIRLLLEQGAAAIKVDFGEGAPPDGVYDGVDARDAHNLYPLLYAAAIWDVSRAVHGDDAVLWARAAWAGSQRYPVHWSGDGVARFADLPCVVRSMLSMGMSGFPFYSHDVGGFSGVPDGQLYIRWLQLGVFSSHVRAHGVPPREPWEYGPEVEGVARALLELRYRLLPYLDAAVVRAATTCVPVARALAWDFPDDPMAASIDDAFMFGDALYVAPILDQTGRRRVYLPAGTWTEWWTHEPVAGGAYVDVDVALDRVPLWIRENSLVALGPAVQHTEDGRCEPLTLVLVRPASGQARVLPSRHAPVDVSWQRAGRQVQVSVAGVVGMVRVAVVGATVVGAPGLVATVVEGVDGVEVADCAGLLTLTLLVPADADGDARPRAFDA